MTRSAKIKYEEIEVPRSGWARRLTFAIIGAAAWSVAASCAAATFSQFIVFGDSTVDTGYYRALPNPGGSATYNAYWPAAVANGAGIPTSSPGLMYPQVLASYFGLTANPSNQSGGTNYATSGAKNVDVNTSTNGGFKAAIPTVTQIANYLAANGNKADANALYLISSGGNEVKFAAGLSGTGPFPSDPTSYMTTRANSLATAIASLMSGGAKRFVVANLPASFPLNNPTQQQLKAAYNQALFSSLASQGVPVIQADIDSVRLAIQNNPGQYGFTSISNAAGSTACTAPSGITSVWGLLCSSSPNAPSTFASPNADMTSLFADDEHLATAGQKIIADYIYGLLNSSSDCLFNWAEKNYSNLFAPPSAASITVAPYYYRYYSLTNAYLGTSSADDHVYYKGPATNNSIVDEGALTTWLTTAACQ